MRSIISTTLTANHLTHLSVPKYRYVLRHRQVNHARNLWDRAITILPRANQFWYKYTYMEELLGNVSGQWEQTHTQTARRRIRTPVTCCYRHIWLMFSWRQVRDRCLSAGWSGSRRSRRGIPTSTSSCATRSYSEHEPSTNAISFHFIFTINFISPK